MEFHIAIAPEQITQWWGLPITNTLLSSWMAMAVLIVFSLLVSRGLSFKPGKFQNFIEMIFEYVIDFMEHTFGDRKIARLFFPFVTTLFLFIWVSNWLEFLPGFGSIGLAGECGKAVCEPLFRSANTDLNVTIALAAAAMGATEIAGLWYLGAFGYLKKFFDFSGPLNFFIGLIELVSEAARLISFSFRLFGNIFAGEVLIIVMTAFLPIALPVPFMLFELFVGFIQAAIFALLTLFFIKIAITEKGH
ncbi:F0F1 ATP synthase subunit A [Candidatus Azambacteria bacterium]|nr:F0F1 ATP synthase subunit A [Candidatus Azambacteria bacterium]MBI3685121.1 F0F1 ATP synthase subunit A [Candidatus Azambacteria bacterium]